MKIMIAYATKSGAARECASILSQRLAGSKVFDLNKETPQPDDYDIIIIGSGVRMGKIYKPAKKYLENNMEKLLSKKMAIYLCNAYPDTLQKVINTNISERLKTSVIQIKSFGGKPPFKGNADVQTWLDSASVSEFIKVINA